MHLARKSRFAPLIVTSVCSLHLGCQALHDNSRPLAQPEPRQPNIVLLFSDDAGYADFGFQNASDAAVTGLTPHIDSIARDGATLGSFYMVSPVCSPSRAGLLSGRYPQRFGHEINLPIAYMGGGMDLAQSTLADRLKAEGYATACIGKWHLGYPADYHPNQRGFDHFFGCIQGSRSYLPIEEPSLFRVLQRNGEPTPEGGYVTDRLGDAAVQFMREHRSEPFFLYLSFTAPHGPLEPRPGALESQALAHIPTTRRRQFVGLLQALDDNVGKVLDALDELGLSENTLVVFTNDNGGQTQVGALNTPLRGRKGQLWEGGIRVPCCVRWPGVVEGGSRLELPANALDLSPTFLAAAGADLAQHADLDGTDLAPWLVGGSGDPPQRTLFWRHKGSYGPRAARRGNWKVLREDPGQAAQLFDLEHDPEEAVDLASAHPERVNELLAELESWTAELEDPRWSRRSAVESDRGR